MWNPFARPGKSSIPQRYTQQLAALITLVITLTIVAYLTAPQYLPYSQEVVTVSEQEDGTVYLTFSQQVAGYEMLSSNGTGSGTEYLVTAWNTTWHKRVSPKDIGSIVVNPNREKVAAIYYYTAEYPSNDVYGDNTHLLYGNLTAEGFVVLPRLFLAYYVFFALLLLGLWLCSTWYSAKMTGPGVSLAKPCCSLPPIS